MLRLVKDGPCAHIKFHSFQYFTTIQEELVRIERIKGFQNNVFTLVCSVLLALNIALFNMLAQVYLTQWFAGVEDSIVPTDDDSWLADNTTMSG